MIRVSAEEHDLLSVARACFGLVPAASVGPLLRRDGAVVPTALGREALAELERTLAVGSVSALMRRGGWLREPAFRGEEVVTGRLWERQSAPTLSFTSTSYDVLWWLLGAPVKASAPRSEGDELVVYLAADLWVSAGRDAAAMGAWISSTLVARLAFPEANSDVTTGPWLGRALLFEALQRDLMRQVVRIDARLRRDTDLETMTALARRHERDLASLLATCAEEGRLDLMTFVVDATERILATRQEHAATRQRSATLRERSSALAASAGIYRIVGLLHREHERLRHVGFTDDGHAHAQALLHRWERFAENGFQVAETEARRLSALDVGLEQQ